MFSKLSKLQRIPIAFAFIIAFALVLGSNLLDKKHYSEISQRVNSVYKDRVVVQGYIFELSNIFHQKSLNLLHGHAHKVDTVANKRVQKLLQDFRLTQLTVEESELLKELNVLFDELRREEKQIDSSADGTTQKIRPFVVATLQKINNNLDALMKVQVKESDKQTILSKDSLHMIITLSKIEMIFLVIVGIGILLLFFYPVKEESQDYSVD